MNELYESVDKNKLKFEYVGNTKEVTFYEYMDSREPFDKIKNNQLKFDDALKRQEEFLKKSNEVKQVEKTINKTTRLIILISFTILEKKFFIFLETVIK